MEHVRVSEPDDDDERRRAHRRPPADERDGRDAAARDRAGDQADRQRGCLGHWFWRGGPDCFSAGADLKAVPDYGPAQQREMVSGINAMALGVYELEFPVVGAITGHAIAGGLVLALCTERSASPPARGVMG